jgi:hypothetical protein
MGCTGAQTAEPVNKNRQENDKNSPLSKKKSVADSPGKSSPYLKSSKKGSPSAKHKDSLRTSSLRNMNSSAVK